MGRKAKAVVKSDKSLTKKISDRLIREPFGKVWSSLSGQAASPIHAQIASHKLSAAKATDSTIKKFWLEAARSLEAIIETEKNPAKEAFVDAVISGLSVLGINVVRAGSAPTVSAGKAKRGRPVGSGKKSKGVSKKPLEAADEEQTKKIIAFLKSEKTSDKSNGRTPRAIFDGVGIKPVNLSKTFGGSKEVGSHGHARGKVYFYKGA